MLLAADKFIKMALEEDINSEDVTTNSVMPHYKKGQVELICKEDGIVAGFSICIKISSLKASFFMIYLVNLLAKQFIFAQVHWRFLPR